MNACAEDPEHYAADPHLGNYTQIASLHAWCANALAIAVSSETFTEFNDDIQHALRYLLCCETARVRKALDAEHF